MLGRAPVAAVGDAFRRVDADQRGGDALGKLTLEQVNAALRNYIKPESFVSAVAGDFKP